MFFFRKRVRFVGIWLKAEVEGQQSKINSDSRKLSIVAFHVKGRGHLLKIPF